MNTMVFDTRLATKNDLKPLATREGLMEGLGPVKAGIARLKCMTGMILAGLVSLILKNFF
ncbi:hypothetical protein [Bordetella petrii]|uniref:hypothetical protein n=1 Tax=Bordetella petrii TaxID=94624 RepID=UPI001E59CB4E|nr:hypothetical protein [Bordetella petrii]MCD0506125.1 hypothetical protein [Bordetella petrii]